MIIDLRVRPPYREFLDMPVFSNPQFTTDWANRLSLAPAPSCLEKSMPLFLDELETAGITYSVIAGRQGSATAKVPNDDIVSLMEEYPNKFIGAAGIDPTDPTKALAEIERTVVNGPLTAVHMEPGLMKTPLYADDKSIYPIYEYCANHGVPILITASGCNGPDVSYGNPAIFDRICAAFPTATFVVVHGGYPSTTETLFVAFKRPNMYLCPTMFMFNMPGVEDYVQAANTFMQDRFMFGSAYPFTAHKDAVETFCKLPFKPELLSKFLWKNAAKALKFEVQLKAI